MATELTLFYSAWPEELPPETVSHIRQRLVTVFRRLEAA